MSIKTKQVAGVTTLVALIVALLTAYHLMTLARLNLDEIQARGEMITRALFQSAVKVVPPPGTDLYSALRADSGVRSTLESGLGYGPAIYYVAIVDRNGIAVAHSTPANEGQPLPEQQELTDVINGGSLAQLKAVTTDNIYEIRRPLLADEQQFGSIRVGISTILIRDEFKDDLGKAAGSVVAALFIATFASMFLANWMLRPIHVIQSGLTRLGRGELDVSLDLPGEEFRDLGSSFEAVSAQLAAVRSRSLPAAATDLESVMENLEDAVALFAPSGEVMFTNAAMKALLVEHGDHPAMRGLIDQTLAGRKSLGPVSIAKDPEHGESPERLLVTHAIYDHTERFLGAMLVARNLGYLSHVHTTLNYSRKLSALGRLMAGVAHEVKNPLNAMTIHLELLKQKLARQTVPAAAGALAATDVQKHVSVIAQEISRLDEVVVGFLKFARPEELKLQPVKLSALIGDVATSVGVEAERSNVSMKVDCSPTLPPINADPGMLRQAILNLAINACQAMPHGGSLKMSCRATSSHRVEVDVEDTGVGIAPDHLDKIFDLYFTTKEKGSGIGLSMVYRIVQLHDGEVEVQSTPGSGTRFRLIFPQA